MAKELVSADVERPAGDTFPSKSTIKVNGVPIDLTDWDVDLRYMKDDVEWVINCIATDVKGGRVSIYPHGRTRAEADASGTRLSPEDYVMTGLTGANQVWDEDEANAKYPFYLVRTRLFDGYLEEMTHNSGSIQLAARYLS